MSQYRTALIVGAGSGLSASLARLFGKKGLKSRSPPATPSGSRSWRRRPPRSPSPARRPTATRWRRCSPTCGDVGAPDIVVYNALPLARGPVIELDPAEVARAIAVSGFGGFLVAQQAARRMLPQGRARSC